MSLSMPERNTQWRLRRRPDGAVRREDFDVSEGEIPQPGNGEVQVRNIYLLVPPSMRLWMNERPSYFPPQPLGEVMMGITLGVVTLSRDGRLPVGTYVNGMGGWQLYYTAPVDQLQPLQTHPEIPLGAYRTVLDVQGLTAYCGLMDICRPQAGETLVVTAAAGSVGSLVCQIGSKLGLNVIGIAGGQEKCRWLREACGVAAAIDYRNENVGARLDTLCPGGINMLFENVGGPVMDAVLYRLADRARVALCGMVSTYDGGATQSSDALMQLVNRSARMEGFLLLNYMDRYAEVMATLQEWILDGSLQYQIEVLKGMDRIVDAMRRIARGENRGVQLVQFSPEHAA